MRRSLESPEDRSLVTAGPDAELLKRWGIEPGYEDFQGEWRDSPVETLAKILDVMGADGDPPPSSVRVIKVGDRAPVAGATELRTEDGASLRIDDVVPPDLGCGYHELVDLTDGAATRLIVTPGACYLPEDLLTWGWATQLYAVRSEGSWGQGDLSDLRQLARFSRYVGAGVTMINPLHAVNPGLPQQASPYYPSSRWLRNPLYLKVEEVPGARELLEIEELALRGTALNDARRVDRAAIYSLKMQALDLLWTHFAGDERFESYLAEQGPDHEGLSVFMALAEANEGPWQEWPEGLRHPHSADVEHFKRDNYGRIRFHRWVQWLLEEQLTEASTEVSVIHDLAIGVNPTGADAWWWQDVFATGTSIGAPADDYAREGQGWGILG
ncbi:MAG: 4-alpha-glucanotransferase, partial [Actinomycetota bacterium]|nr:4-alpha-glucanotransferase [Actinomycetota bacterium]